LRLIGGGGTGKRLRRELISKLKVQSSKFKAQS